MITNRERIKKTLNFDLDGLDRLPLSEWAPWWNETLERWQGEGIDKNLKPLEVAENLGVDTVFHLWISPRDNSIPKKEEGQARIKNERDYKELKEKYLYTDKKISDALTNLSRHKDKINSGEMGLFLSVEGFFWYPRTLLGVEGHMMAFYDYPELMHEINHDCMTYNKRIIEALCSEIVPDYVTFAEDLSYNKGPMLSGEMFDEFMLPYYLGVVPDFKKYGIPTFMDSDGYIDGIIDWILKAGLDGLGPLERQSDVDIVALREKYPKLLMIGGFDKRVMHLGEQAIRDEFERILPVMQSGGYIQSADHQTPPEVSLADYKLYRQLQEEYCHKAVGK